MKTFTLSNQQLIEAYTQARKLNLDEEFIHMLKKEIEARNLSKKAEPSDA
jgi:hypothetical protein